MESKIRKTLRGVILACVMAASMVLSPILSVHADPLPPTSGSLTIKKYYGNVGDTSTPVDGIKFNLYKVDTSSTVPLVGSGVSYQLIGSTLMVYDDHGVVAGAFAVTPAATPTVTTGSLAAGQAKASNLPQGLYLVIEDLAHSTPTTGTPPVAVSISTAHVPFLVAVPMTNATGDGWITDVIVEPKNQPMTITKDVSITDGDAVVVGEIIKYTIESTVPSDIATSRKYDIVDQLDEALDYQANSVVVTELPSNTQLTVGTHYTVSCSNNKLIVSLLPAGRQKLAADGAGKVKVEFNVAVNDKILSKPNYGVANEAEVQFTNEAGEDYTAKTGGRGPRIHTAGIEITKKDQMGFGLTGATFRIASSLQNAKDGKYLMINSDKKIIDSATPGINTAGYSVYEVSPANVAAFTGLRDKFHGAYQTYYLVEVKAPAGYNLLDSPIEVSFDISTDTTHQALVEVINVKGFILPQTGGMGTMIFSVAGVALLGLAAALSLGKKNRKQDIA